ncbi:glycerophosphodiester phosphodiesterase [Fodinibius salsisoli]|uniref:GP-PDE domain-containing protein n=1 Tax=Fodinibius salsisoli TaxID=2820877 RepID=A0ABT3PPJ0_9BACT|nr:glycerophosphodiester phosphodiesterase family protein [Fodinibius salsisoli]MCW9707777.1 hypothetical protein [Fodinibius salsisoli]
MDQQAYRLPDLFHHSYEECIVIAHRGASAYYPENTLPAFKGALEMEAAMIELDVMLTSDGVPVVFHDAKLSIHSNGKGLLSYHTLEELKAFDAGAWFSPQYAGTTIPTLQEVLELVAGKIALNIEIKTEAVSAEISGGVEEKCLQLVHDLNMQHHVLFSSFDYRALRHLKKLDSEIPVALLYNRGQSNGRPPAQLMNDYQVDAFNCSYHEYMAKWGPELHQLNIPHFVYTVDETDQMQQLLDADVSGIFTNRPDRLKALIDQRRNGKKT